MFFFFFRLKIKEKLCFSQKKNYYRISQSPNYDKRKVVKMISVDFCVLVATKVREKPEKKFCLFSAVSSFALELGSNSTLPMTGHTRKKNAEKMFLVVESDRRRRKKTGGQFKIIYRSLVGGRVMSLRSGKYCKMSRNFGIVRCWNFDFK